MAGTNAGLNAQAINARIRIGEMLVGMLAKDPDPRAPEVSRILQGQIAELRAQLAEYGQAEQQPAAEEKRDDGGKPPAQVVGLSALRLRAKRL